MIDIRMRLTITRIGLIAIGLITVGLIFTSTSQADDQGRFKDWFEREGHHGRSLSRRDDEGNEAVGQMAAWLLAVANLPVVLSVLIKWTNTVGPMGKGLKDGLARFNRLQKKHLMRLHFLLNPIALGIALWHWMTSCCRSTALPEWGLALMATLIVFGVMVKFRLCPKYFRKSLHRIHTQPLIFITMVMILTIGHLIAD